MVDDPLLHSNERKPEGSSKLITLGVRRLYAGRKKKDVEQEGGASLEKSSGRRGSKYKDDTHNKVNSATEERTTTFLVSRPLWYSQDQLGATARVVNDTLSFEWFSGFGAPQVVVCFMPTDGKGMVR